MDCSNNTLEFWEGCKDLPIYDDKLKAWGKLIGVYKGNDFPIHVIFGEMKTGLTYTLEDANKSLHPKKIGYDITEMDFNSYQEKAWVTAKYPNMHNNLTYPTLGLTGEAGEIANKVKKIQRDYNSILTLKMRETLIDELGDVLWYIAAIATELNCPLENIAKNNIIKLYKRLEENKISGEGDNR